MKSVSIVVFLAILILLATAMSYAGTSTLAVGPTNVTITMNGTNSVQQDFTVMCHTGNLHIEPVGVPVSITPSDINITSLSEVITVTITPLTNNSGVYKGYIKFIKGTDSSTSLAVSVAININIIATVTGSPGGGGGQVIEPTITPTITPTPTVTPSPTPVATPEPTPEPTPTPVEPTPTPDPTIEPTPVEPTPTPTVVVGPVETIPTEPEPTKTAAPTIIPTDNDNGSNWWIWLLVIGSIGFVSFVIYELVSTKKLNDKLKREEHKK
jgi:hypothetical protein